MRHYQVDSQASRFFVMTGSGGVFGAFGHKHKIAVSGFSGDLTFSPADLSKAVLNLNVSSPSLSVVADNKKEEKDKPKIEEEMQTKVLDVAKYPTISFHSTGVSATPLGGDEFDAVIRGDLTLHGVTRAISIPAKLKLEAARLTAGGSFSLKQTDYGIQPVSAAGGTVKVKDEVRLTFEMTAHP